MEKEGRGAPATIREGSARKDEKFEVRRSDTEPDKIPLSSPLVIRALWTSFYIWIYVVHLYDPTFVLQIFAVSQDGACGVAV